MPGREAGHQWNKTENRCDLILPAIYCPSCRVFSQTALVSCWTMRCIAIKCPKWPLFPESAWWHWPVLPPSWRFSLRLRYLSVAAFVDIGDIFSDRWSAFAHSSSGPVADLFKACMQVHGALTAGQTHTASKLKPEMARPASRPDKVRLSLSPLTKQAGGQQSLAL